MKVVTWAGLQHGTTETCSVDETSAGVLVESVIHSPFGERAYTLTTDTDWRFRELRLTLGNRTLHLAFDGRGWTVDGQERRDLEAAREVDLSLSPLSNTLPIRRLRPGDHRG